MSNLVQLSDYAHRRQSTVPQRAPATVTSISDYRLTFSRGWLRWGPYYRRLTANEAGDLAETLYWALATSSQEHQSVGEPAAGLLVIGHRPHVTIEGFGPPLRGEALHELIRELQRFYKRRSRA